MQPRDEAGRWTATGSSGGTTDFAGDYRGSHTAPDRDFGAPAHDMTGFYPADIYTPQGLHYYRAYWTGQTFDADSDDLTGSRNVDLDRFAWQFINNVRGKPDVPVEIYRAVPLNAQDSIAAGDWVTIAPEYARDHGISALNGSFKILSATVRSGDLFTNGDSWLEWGWSPETESVLPVGIKGAMRDDRKIDVEPFVKHLAGTENDHDQQSHAGGGGSGRSELSDSEMQEIVYSSATVSEMYGKIADALGKTMRPTVAELDDSEVTLYRGLANFDRDVRQLLDGTVPETDLQTWGEGIYATSDREEAERYGQVVRMSLDDSARIVDGEYEWSEAFTVDWPDSGPPTTSVFDISRIDDRISISSLYNVYWASKGYDGYRPYGGYGEGETVLFNGEKLTVDRRDVGSDVVKHLAGRHDQKTHGSWAQGVPHALQDFSNIERLRQSGAIKSVEAIAESDGTIGVKRVEDVGIGQHSGEKSYWTEDQASSEERLRETFNSPQGTFIPENEYDVLRWFAKQTTGDADNGPGAHWFNATPSAGSQAILSALRFDENLSDSQREQLQESISRIETFEPVEVFLAGYREGLEGGLSDNQARNFGRAIVLRTDRYLWVEGQEKSLNALESAKDDVTEWSEHLRRFRPSESSVEAAKSLKANGQVAVAVHTAALDSVIADGGLKNQYQSGESSGMYSPQKRKMYEAAYLGIPMDTVPKDRPIYGYVFDPTMSDKPSVVQDSLAGLRNDYRSFTLGNDGVSQYGNIRLVLDSKVKERTTFSGGDSLDSRVLSVPLVGNLTERDYAAASLYSPSSYYEAQIHRGVKLSDVVSVHIPQTSFSTSFSRAESVDSEVARIRDTRRSVEQKFRDAGVTVPVTIPDFITLFDGTVIPIGDE